jgi:hypothetical protein
MESEQVTATPRSLLGLIVHRSPFTVMCVLLLAVAACGPTKVTIATSPEMDQYRVRTVAMLPFEDLATPMVVDPKEPDVQPPQGAVRSDISLSIPRTNERYEQPTNWVPPAAAAKVEGIVYGKLQRWSGIQVLPPQETARAIKVSDVKGLPLEKMVQQVAAKLSVDAVLKGRVLAYEERVGSKLGVSKPATVGFEVKLIAADGRVLWVGNYYERQRPMIEDLAGFIQRGGVFVTAEELAEYGADHMLEKFPFGAPAR